MTADQSVRQKQVQECLEALLMAIGSDGKERSIGLRLLRVLVESLV